jgi:CheY-like chemotaxis protein
MAPQQEEMTTAAMQGGLPRLARRRCGGSRMRPATKGPRHVGADPVLWVDENPADLLLAREALRDLGPVRDVRFARDGAEALRETRRVRPALVVLDPGMPPSRGFATLGTLRQKARVVVFSGEPDYAAECQRLGAPFVPKPLGWLAYREAVAGILAHAARDAPDR